VAKPKGAKRGQRRQPDQNILNLIQRNTNKADGKGLWWDVKNITNILYRSNKPARQHEVEAAIKRLLNENLIVTDHGYLVSKG
jgi:hypothetical protein